MSLSFRVLPMTALLLANFGLVSIPHAAEPAGAVEALNEEDILAGHSYHGEFLNEGPRQAAYLMTGTGAVKFPVTTDDPQAQAFIEQGIGQLYGFWYLEAERSFRQAATLDPDCAMAFWGAALATKKSQKRARGFIAEAVERKATVSKREKMYIEAFDAYLNFGVKKEKTKEGEANDSEEKEKPLDQEQKKKRAEAYTKALEAIALDFPEDIEAKAFLALQLYDNRGELPNPSYLAVDGLLDKVFAAEPMHSAHHFRIHLWDYKKPEMALASAALCGQSAPGIAHMWHMPGHIFSRLKRYDDAAWQQEASARVDHAHMIRDRVLPDEIHNFAHNNEWLIRNLNHVGRVRDAIDLAKNMIELPRHPKYNTLDKRGSAYYGRLRLMETLNRYELWEEAFELCHTPYIEPTSKEKEQHARLALLGTASFMTGRDAAGEAALKQLQDELEQKRKAQQTAGHEAANKETEKLVDKKLIQAAGEKARREAMDRVQAIGEKETPAAESPTEEATASSEDEDRVDATETADSTQPAETEPAEELDVEALVASAEQASREEQLKQHRKAIDKARNDARKPLATPINDLVKAVAQVEAFREIARGNYDAALPLMKKASRNVSPLQLAMVQLRCGDFKPAIETATKEVDRNKNEVRPSAALVELLFETGDWEAAQERLDQLRAISSSIDLQAPLLERIGVIAERMGSEGDWRNYGDPKEDIGVRPELDALGPFRWSPSAAPSWKLTDAQDKLRTLADYEGKPVIVIF